MGCKESKGAEKKKGSPVEGTIVSDIVDAKSLQEEDEWPAAEFAANVAQAKRSKDYDRLKSLLREVAENNFKLQDRWTVPRSVPVKHADCKAFKKKLGKPPRISISTMSTAEAFLYFGKDRKNVCCGLNFANGEDAGGGYKNGSTAQEEDLCRRMPSLYASLRNAVDDGLYPFGPCTCTAVEDPAKYSDVLYTTGLIVARSGDEDGYALLPEKRQVKGSLVAAAAPNINFRKEISNPNLMYQTVESIFIAPKILQPEVNTLILGAWGCGAFGGDPDEISKLFSRALTQDKLGQLYKEVHFAIPRTSPTDKNNSAFKLCLRDNIRGLREMP